MQPYYFLIPLSLLMGGTALWAFFWTLRTDQYEDMKGASERVLFDTEDEFESPDLGDDAEAETDGKILPRDE